MNLLTWILLKICHTPIDNRLFFSQCEYSKIVELLKRKYTTWQFPITRFLMCRQPLALSDRRAAGKNGQKYWKFVNFFDRLFPRLCVLFFERLDSPPHGYPQNDKWNRSTKPLDSALRSMATLYGSSMRAGGRGQGLLWGPRGGDPTAGMLEGGWTQHPKTIPKLKNDQIRKDPKLHY